MYISLEASIGVGKSTLLPSLAQELGMIPVEENLAEGSEFLTALGEFNKDKSKALKLQITINKMRNKLAKTHLIGEHLVERSMFSDIVFTKVMYDAGYMTLGEFNLFYAMAMENVKTNPPEVVIHLACDAHIAYDRMRSRGREEEDKNSLQYMIDLEDAHEDMLVDMCAELDIPLIRIDYNHFVEAREVAESVHHVQFLQAMT